MGDFFGSKPATQSSQIKLGPEQQEVFKYAMPYIRDFASSGIKLPTGSGVAGFDPLQLQAQDSAIAAALGNQTGLANQGFDTSKFLLGDVLNPASNPALQQYMSGATRQITDDFLQNVMPEIRGQAITTGNFGSSGQGIATGLAASEAAKRVGDTQANIANTAYGQGLGAMQNALQMLPSTMSAMLSPTSTLASVGDVRQGMSQTLLDEIRNRFMQEQTLPLDIGSQLLSLISGMPGSKSVATGSAPQASPFSQMLGLGAMLAGL